ncbi:MAG TPA: hypothetical protein VNA26_07715 [Chitinophagaceae bacterium]|nr:hypothetical protein [Chitinophagaceae bacterium]
MKKGVLLLLLVSSIFAEAQSLKEALYGGKLKNQPGSVIRKGDDLSTKMDTARKTSTNDSLAKTTVLKADSSAKRGANQPDSAVISGIEEKDNISVPTNTTTPEIINASKENTPVLKDNNVAWREYIDSVTSILKAEVLPSKKIKNGTYYVTVSYSIGTDGQVTINNVLLTPENTFLQQQVKDRIAIDAPRLNPVLSGSGAPRKASKNYNFTLSKE